MWLSSMCVTNQALQNTFLELSKEGVVLSQEIDIPMDERYTLMLLFRPTDQGNPNSARTSFAQHVCSKAVANSDVSLPVTENGIGNKLSFEVEITTKDGKQLSRNQFTPDCSRSAGNPNTLNFGALEMKQGKYNIRVTNQVPFVLEQKGKFQVLLRGVGAGYP